MTATLNQTIDILASDLADTTAQAILADALADAGRDGEAILCRTELPLMQHNGRVIQEPVARPATDSKIAMYRFDGEQAAALLAYAVATHNPEHHPKYLDLPLYGVALLDGSDTWVPDETFATAAAMLDAFAEAMARDCERIADHTEKGWVTSDFRLAVPEAALALLPFIGGSEKIARRCRKAARRIKAALAAKKRTEAEAARAEVAAAKAVAAKCSSDAWTLGEAVATKGHDARIAERALKADPKLLYVVVSDDAPTRRGLRLVDSSRVLYYRKSKGGKWGRCVQQKYVAV